MDFFYVGETTDEYIEVAVYRRAFSARQELYISLTEGLKPVSLCYEQYRESIANDMEIDRVGYYSHAVLCALNKGTVSFDDFKTLEGKILREKLKTQRDLRGVLATGGLDFRMPTDHEWEIYGLYAKQLASQHVKDTIYAKSDFYVVPFEHAAVYLSLRKNIVWRGNVWVVGLQIIDVLVFLQGIHLDRQLASFQSMPRKESISTDPAVEELASQVEKVTLQTRKRTLTGTEKSPADLDVLALPPCITAIQNVLTSATPHLKYQARLTLSLFYSNLGLDRELSISYLEQEYSKSNHWRSQWVKTYRSAYSYLLNSQKEYKMLCCSTLVKKDHKDVGGCVFLSTHECKRATLGKGITGEYKNPVELYELQSRPRPPPRKVITPKKQVVFKNDSFNKFI
jgi:DNA primase large subunit